MFKKIDLKIILALQEDGRASYAELAVKLQITPSTVAKRIRYLLESKAITIKALPNPEKLGLVANALITIKADRSKIDKICNKLINNFNVNLVQTVFGRFDILIIVYFRTWETLNVFINEDLSLIEGILKIETHYIRDMKKRYELIFTKDSDKQTELQLKENDWKLIKELAKDGRTSVKELAQTLNMPTSIVSRKIATLVDCRTIKISAVPNPVKFGYTGKAFIVMTINASKVEAICNALHLCAEIHLIITMINGSEIIIGIQTPNSAVLYESIKKNFSNISGIYSTETLVSAEVRKRRYGWFLEEDAINSLPIISSFNSK